MILDTKIFYKTYPAEFHWYKVRMLKCALLNQQDLYEDCISRNHNSEELKRFERMLKLEMRQTYFHCMETMFTLLFALDPFKNTLDDTDLFYKISISDIDYIYSRIQSIAKQASGLNFLKKKIRVGNTKNWNHVGRFIFYKDVTNAKSQIPDLDRQINESIDAIIYGLQALAQDFSDRDEYNAYKHGLRLVPAIQGSLIFTEVKNQAKKIHLDFSDSISFFKRRKRTDQSDSIESETRIFTTERDYEMTTFCSNLICSMIETRRAIYFQDSIDENGVIVRLYSKDAIDQCTKGQKDYINFKTARTPPTEE